jgi:hypothetical protein
MTAIIIIQFNSLFLCAASTAKRPITDTAQHSTAQHNNNNNEWWGLPLAQEEKYQGRKKTCDKK